MSRGAPAPVCARHRSARWTGDPTPRGVRRAGSPSRRGSSPFRRAGTGPNCGASSTAAASPHLGLLGRVVGLKRGVADRGWSSRARQRRSAPPGQHTRPREWGGRRRVKEQEEEQGHRKDPRLAGPITLATASSSRVGVLCGNLATYLVRAGGATGAAGPPVPAAGATPSSISVSRTDVRTAALDRQARRRPGEKELCSPVQRCAFCPKWRSRSSCRFATQVSARCYCERRRSG